MHKVISRKEAVLDGLKQYFTGMPCPSGHIAPRKISGGSCIECAKAVCRSWRSRNKERTRKYLRQWTQENAARAKRRRRAYEKANPDYISRERQRSNEWAGQNRGHLSKYRLSWAKNNRDREVVHLRNRRARKRGNGGSHTPEEVAELLVRQGGLCEYCRCDITPKNKTVDHIVPLSKGGRNDVENLQILCRPCNSRKGVKDASEFVCAIDVEYAERPGSAQISVATRAATAHSA